MNKLLAALVAGFFAAGAFAAQDASAPAPVPVPSASVHAVKTTHKAAKKKVRHVVHKAHAAKKV
jgi:hypothetical protein